MSEPFEPLALMVHGRLKAPVAALVLMDGGETAVIEVDDDKDDAFWCRVELTREQVAWLYRVMFPPVAPITSRPGHSIDLEDE